MTFTRLDRKLANILRDPSGSKDFIICDAKDSDMGFGRAHTGPIRGEDGQPTRKLHSKAAFLEQIRAIVAQDLVDMVLMSVSTYERAALEEGWFDQSEIAVAIRANDATDVWGLRGAAYGEGPSRPFRTAELSHAQATPGARRPADLGLYSITFNNDVDEDLRTLEAYRAFRAEAQARGFPYFLEVFNPNRPRNLSAADAPFFVNDCIVRALAGVPRAARPRFLKLVYNGPEALEELASYDPELIVGVLGGSSGTCRDCLQLVHDAKKYGARVALFGRKINLAEDPLGMIEQMRRVADGDADPQEAVRAYHGGLQRKNIPPARPLDDDLRVTEPSLR